MTGLRTGDRYWLDGDWFTEKRDCQLCVGETVTMPIGKVGATVECDFVVARVDRLRHRVLLEVP